jgi:hypothetical protein
VCGSAPGNRAGDRERPLAGRYSELLWVRSWRGQRPSIEGQPPDRRFLSDSVEKLISQAHGILQANAEVAENPHETRGMAHCAQLWSEIVGNRSPLGSLDFQPF